MLLRAGASLDDEAAENGYKAAEDIVKNYYGNSDNEATVAIKALIAGVRKYGTYKRYMCAPHRDVLACRGLAMRGKLQTDDRALAFLAKQGDNGIVWNILSYWRATD